MCRRHKETYFTNICTQKDAFCQFPVTSQRHRAIRLASKCVVKCPLEAVENIHHQVLFLKGQNMAARQDFDAPVGIRS
jgi:2-iminoacetate synthase ThiH